MDRPLAAIVATSSTQLPDTRLRGSRRALARTVWVILFVLNLVWFALALVSQVTSTLHPCVAATCTLTPSQAELLRHQGIGLGTVAAYYVGMPALTVVASLIMAILLFWRRSDDWLALVVGLFLVYRVSSFAFGSLDVNGVGPSALILALAFADTVIFYGVFLIFPDGRFVPRWAWLLLAAWATFEAVNGIAQVSGVTVATVPSWLYFIWGFGYPVLYLSALGTQIYRYRRVSNGRQRQQTKWVILGFAVALGANILYWIVLPLALPPWLSPQSLHAVNLLYPLVAYPLYELATVALPVSFAIAIQRHQLFDVDVLIKRTLVYGSLTLLLAAVYLGSILGMQQLLRVVWGQGVQAEQNPLVLVLSTLLIAVLVTPVRRRLQATIDRRFYRSRYDAARTLERFAATLRSEVDLRALRENLVEVVQETMQPASVSLWLREAEKTPMDERRRGSE
jgi:hypothetical protein